MDNGDMGNAKGRLEPYGDGEKRQKSQRLKVEFDMIVDGNYDRKYDDLYPNVDWIVEES